MPIDIYADGATLENFEELEANPIIKGYTFNPSLLKKAGVTDFMQFAKKIVSKTDKPISLEVFADDWEGMVKEAEILSNLGENVFVKIPITTTEGIKTAGIVDNLIRMNIKVNYTAIFSYKQIDNAIGALGNTDSIISIFAGRIIDTGRDASPFIQYAKYNKRGNQKILWASSRGLWNIKQAEDAGADIITIGYDILKKMSLWGKDLGDFSLDTVKMFRKDALDSGFTIE